MGEYRTLSGLTRMQDLALRTFPMQFPVTSYRGEWEPNFLAFTRRGYSALKRGDVKKEYIMLKPKYNRPNASDE